MALEYRKCGWRLVLVASCFIGTARGQGSDPKAVDLEPPLPAGAVARLGSSRLTHQGDIRYLAMSRDQKTILSASDDFTWRVWEASNGKESFRKAENWLRTFALAPDESTVAVATWDSIRWYDPATRKLQRTWKIETISGAVFSPDGATLAICLESGEVLLREVASGKEKRRLPKKTAENARCVAFAPSGDKLATAGADGIVRLWDLRTGAEIFRSAALRYGVEFVRIAPSGEYLFYRGHSDFVHRYDLRTGKTAENVPEFADYRSGIDFSPDGKFVSFGCDDRIEIRDTKSSAIVARLPHEPGNRATCLRFSPDGRLLVAGYSHDHGVHIWEIAGQRELVVVPRIVPIESAAFASDDRSLTIVSRTVEIWNLANRRLEKQRSFGTGTRLLTIDGSEIVDGATLRGGYGLQVSRMSLARPDRTQSLSLEKPFFDGIAISPDARTIAVISGDREVFFVELETKSLRKVIGPEESIGSFAVSADGSCIASGRCIPLALADRYRLQLHDVPSGKLRWRRDFPTDSNGNPTNGMLSFAADDASVFAYLGGKAILQRRDAATGDLLQEYAGLEPFYSFSRDGSLLAVRANDLEPHGIDLFETATGQRLSSLALKEVPSYPLAFSNRGDLLASWSEAGTVLLWKVFPPPEVSDKSVTAMTDQKLWEMLASTQGPTAFSAMRLAIAEGDKTVSLLKAKMPPTPPVAAKQIETWIEQLGDDSYPTRESATRRLQEVDRQAEAAVRAAAKTSSSPETQARSKRLLEELQPTRLRPRLLRENRCILVLEQIDSPAARAYLESLANGASRANLTRSARKAIDRQRFRLKFIDHEPNQRPER